MLCAGIDLQVRQQLVAQTGLGQHAFDGLLDEEGRFLCQIVGRRSETLAAGVSGVTRVDLVGHFVARELHLLRVDDDDFLEDQAMDLFTDEDDFAFIDDDEDDEATDSEE